MARLSQLSKIVAELQAQNFDVSTLPANSSIRAYAEWSSDPELRERPDGSVPSSGSKTQLALKAFGLPDTDDDVIVKIGSRAKTRADSLTLTKFGLTETLGDAVNKNGFSPAKCVLALKLQTAGTRQRSTITKRYYRPRTNGSWTIPFGKLTGAATEFAAQEEILSDAAFAAYAITFTPERLRRI